MTKKAKGRGWFEDPYRHALASKGIPTADISETKAKAIFDKESNPHKEKSKEMMESAKEKEKKANKEIKEAKKDIKKGKKEAGEDFWSKTKSGIGSAISSLKGSYKKGKDVVKSISKKEDEIMGNIIGSDIKEGMSSSIDKHIGEDVDRRQGDYTKEDLKQIKESGTPAELVRAVRTGDVIDADVVEISDENAQELAQHMADLRHDVEMSEEMIDRMKDKKGEMERYYREKYDIHHDELKDDWSQIEDTLGEEAREERLNEIKHKDEMYKIAMKNKMAEHKSEYEFAKDVNKALEEIYKNRKEFTKNWLH